MVKVTLNTGEEERTKYYFFVRKPDSDRESDFYNPIKGFFSYSGGVWAYIFRNRKKYEKYDKKIVIKRGKNAVGEEIIDTFPIENKDIDLYKEKMGERASTVNPKIIDDEYHYIFEIKTSKELKNKILMVSWENPINGFFFTAMSAWAFITRNLNEYRDYEKRLRTFNIKTKKDESITPFTNEFISLMKTNNFMRE